MAFDIALFTGTTVALLAGLGISTLIVHRRNHGRLSWKASYRRNLFHMLRAFGWIFAAMQLFIFLPLWLTDFIGFTHWGYPWWTVFVVLALAALGYGLQRVGKFLLQDVDAANMFDRSAK